MRILYVANHHNGGNEEELAITQALHSAGHYVRCLEERQGMHAIGENSYDFLLFHKWADFDTMRHIKIPLVCWYFDLLECDDPSVMRRTAHRLAWAKAVLPLVSKMFCTDGRFAESHEKCVWLPQGVDLRRAKRVSADKKVDVLFTGTIKNCGDRRISWAQSLVNRYGASFRHEPRGRHGDDLAKLIAKTKIVVAPDFPVYDKYWSNRVYLTLGYGGCLLHPYVEFLASQFIDKQDILYYHDRDEMMQLIDLYLVRPKERDELAKSGFIKAVCEHSYADRCSTLIKELGFNG